MARRYNINTVVISLARFDGDVNSLWSFCHSQTWSPVYLDDVAAVFVRRAAENESLIRRFPVNCSSAPIPAMPAGPNEVSRFQHWANAAVILNMIGRPEEAWAASNQAMQIFTDSANLHFIRAQILVAMGNLKQAEHEYQIALTLEPNDVTWASLSDVYLWQGRPADALAAMRSATEISPRPYQMLINLAVLCLRNQEPENALKTLDEAERRASFPAASNPLFRIDVARVRAAAWSALGNSAQAIVFEQQAAQLGPERADIWLELANLYERGGRAEEARHARDTAASLDRKNP
jgi:tetratricopeptide (TPR) repeat protein